MLQPGERVRVLSAVLLPFDGGHAAGIVLWRRFMRAHASPAAVGARGEGIPQAASAASMGGGKWPVDVPRNT